MNAATAVAAGKVSGLLPAQITSFSDALLDVASHLAGADSDQVAAVAAASQLTEIAQTMRFDGLDILQQLRYTMKGVGSKASEFDAVGFDPPAAGRSIITPQTPTQLAAAGYSNGVNVLKFTGNNVPGPSPTSSKPASATTPSTEWSAPAPGSSSATSASSQDSFASTASVPKPPAAWYQPGRTRLLFTEYNGPLASCRE